MGTRAATAAVVGLLLVGCGGGSAGEDLATPGPTTPGPSPSTSTADPSPSPSPSPSAGPASSPDPQTVQVFFMTGDGTDCSAVEPVDRGVGRTEAVATAALDELFAGPTPQEQSRGLSSMFGPGTGDLLRSVRVADGTAYVDLERAVLELGAVGTSCGSAAFLSSVGATVQQFPTVDDVRYAVEGDPARFYELVQAGCPRPRSAGDRCDPEPFRR